MLYKIKDGYIILCHPSILYIYIFKKHTHIYIYISTIIIPVGAYTFNTEAMRQKLLRASRPGCAGSWAFDNPGWTALVFRRLDNRKIPSGYVKIAIENDH